MPPLDFASVCGHCVSVDEKPRDQAGEQLAATEVKLPPTHQKVLEAVRKMTPAEGFASLVASGIYTPDGRLTENYNGQLSRS